MPTAEEFDRAAALVLDALQSVGDADRSARRADGDFGLTGGRVANTVITAIDQSISDLRAAEEALWDFREECQRRAQVCRDYELELASFERRLSAWEARVDETGRIWGSPTRPPLPASWVQTG